MKINAFRALRPPAALAARVASPPYDVVDSDEARALAEGNPLSFLHIIKPEIDLPPGTDVYADEVYETGKANFEKFQSNGYLVRDAEPAIYLYQQILGDHRQTGIVAVCHTDDYEQDLIKKHERTISKKEDDRTRHVATLRANAGPVFLTYRDVPEINTLVKQAQSGDPLFDFENEGVRHRVWRVAACDPFLVHLRALPCAYVADGHHRSASASRVARECRAANPAHTGEEAYNWFLAVLFPAEQLNIMPYNRLVKDLQGQSTEEFLGHVRKSFTVTQTEQVAPSTPGRMCMYTKGQWYRLDWEAGPSEEPTQTLDVSVLQQRLLEPILGITDPRTNPRLTFKGGFDSPAVMQQRVDAGEAAVAFSLHPVTVQQMMAIADANRIMPPKSTWFEPKLRSGLFVNLLDD